MRQQRQFMTILDKVNTSSTILHIARLKKVLSIYLSDIGHHSLPGGRSRSLAGFPTVGAAPRQALAQLCPDLQPELRPAAPLSWHCPYPQLDISAGGRKGRVRNKHKFHWSGPEMFWRRTKSKIVSTKETELWQSICMYQNMSKQGLIGIRVVVVVIVSGCILQFFYSS